MQSRQPIQLCLDGRQLLAHRSGKKCLGRAALAIIRTHLTPAAQQTVFVARLAAEVAQTLAEEGDAHLGARIGDQGAVAFNCHFVGEMPMRLVNTRVSATGCE